MIGMFGLACGAFVLLLLLVQHLKQQAGLPGRYKVYGYYGGTLYKSRKEFKTDAEYDAHRETNRIARTQAGL